MPDSIQTRFDEGILCLQNKKYDEAIHTFREVFDLDPEAAGIHHYLGRSLLGKNLHVEAIEEFSRAIKKNPLDGNSRYWLALVLMEQDRFPEAVPLLYEAIRIGNRECLPLLGTDPRHVPEKTVIFRNTGILPAVYRNFCRAGTASQE